MTTDDKHDNDLAAALEAFVDGRRLIDETTRRVLARLNEQDDSDDEEREDHQHLRPRRYQRCG